MTLDDLRVFVAVCDSGSLSAVARSLSCTQSAVSQHVKRLERELGLSLLERRPRGVTPTPAGRILQAAAADGLGGIDRALRQLRDLQHGGGGSVRIATGATTVRHFMSDAVVTFRRRFPQMSLEFQTENSSRGCFAALAAGDADLAWITIDTAVRGATAVRGLTAVRGIEQRPVADLPWVLAVRADDPLAAKSSIDREDLARIHHIGLPQSSTSHAHLQAQCEELGVRLTSTTGVADWDTAILLAELGLGHAIVPELPGWAAARADHPGVRLVPIPGLSPLSVGWAVRQWDALSPPARAFADTVTQRLCGGPTPGARSPDA
ncbi:LysR family transcriptional regulator [Streptomyces sp. 8N616]|uniref:LysR family transcriptional regulator n=1 Tax=Streptomyces sp. 8N616 TaxID=3457414 RepID=UPI003FCEF49B